MNTVDQSQICFLASTQPGGTKRIPIFHDGWKPSDVSHKHCVYCGKGLANESDDQQS